MIAGGAGGQAADNEGNVTGAASATATEGTAAKKPKDKVRVPERALKQMFYEQIASQDTIGDLIENRFSRFDYSDVRVKGDVATMRVVAHLRRGGSSVRGIMKLRRYDGAWFFETIVDTDTHDQELWDEPRYDPSVIRAVVEAQAQRQDAIREVLQGVHVSFVVDRVVLGSRTARIIGRQVGDEPVTEFLVISKEIDGEKYWFIARFQQG